MICVVPTSYQASHDGGGLLSLEVLCAFFFVINKMVIFSLLMPE